MGRPTVPERALPIPDGLHGERVDAGLAKLLGVPRTRAAAIADAGGVEIDFRVVGRADRLVADRFLTVRWAEDRTAAIEPTTVEDLVVVHDEDDFVVVDKPPGVAAHPSPGWTGPTVVGALAAAGYRISTSGAAERTGVVHRLDAGTSGLMVVAKSEAAYTALKRAFKDRTVDKDYLALAPSGPDGRHDRCADRPPPAHPVQIRGHRGGPERRHPLRDPGGVPGGHPARGPSRDRAYAPDPGASREPEASARRRHDVRRGSGAR